MSTDAHLATIRRSLRRYHASAGLVRYAEAIPDPEALRAEALAAVPKTREGRRALAAAMAAGTGIGRTPPAQAPAAPAPEPAPTPEPKAEAPAPAPPAPTPRAARPAMPAKAPEGGPARKAMSPAGGAPKASAPAASPPSQAATQPPSTDAALGNALSRRRLIASQIGEIEKRRADRRWLAETAEAGVGEGEYELGERSMPQSFEDLGRYVAVAAPSSRLFEGTKYGNRVALARTFRRPDGTPIHVYRAHDPRHAGDIRAFLAKNPARHEGAESPEDGGELWSHVFSAAKSKPEVYRVGDANAEARRVGSDLYRVAVPGHAPLYLDGEKFAQLKAGWGEPLAGGLGEAQPREFKMRGERPARDPDLPPAEPVASAPPRRSEGFPSGRPQVDLDAPIPSKMKPHVAEKLGREREILGNTRAKSVADAARLAMHGWRDRGIGVHEAESALRSLRSAARRGLGPDSPISRRIEARLGTSDPGVISRALADLKRLGLQSDVPSRAFFDPKVDAPLGAEEDIEGLLRKKAKSRVMLGKADREAAKVLGSNEMLAERLIAERREGATIADLYRSLEGKVNPKYIAAFLRRNGLYTQPTILSDAPDELSDAYREHVKSKVAGDPAAKVDPRREGPPVEFRDPEMQARFDEGRRLGRYLAGRVRTRYAGPLARRMAGQATPAPRAEPGASADASDLGDVPIGPRLASSAGAERRKRVGLEAAATRRDIGLSGLPDAPPSANEPRGMDRRMLESIREDKKHGRPYARPHPTDPRLTLEPSGPRRPLGRPSRIHPGHVALLDAIFSDAYDPDEAAKAAPAAVPGRGPLLSGAARLKRDLSDAPRPGGASPKDESRLGRAVGASDRHGVLKRLQERGSVRASLYGEPAKRPRRIGIDRDAFRDALLAGASPEEAATAAGRASLAKAGEEAWDHQAEKIGRAVDASAGRPLKDWQFTELERIAGLAPRAREAARRRAARAGAKP